MTVTKEELEARNLVDRWVDAHNTGLTGLFDQEKDYLDLVGIVQKAVKARDENKRHADEGWKLANQRTAERQGTLKALKILLEVMSQNIFVTHVPGTSLGAAREEAEAVVKKFKPLLEG